jgi:hypothetical protein
MGIGADPIIAADALECLLLEHAQDLGMRGRRHVADLIECAVTEACDPKLVL